MSDEWIREDWMPEGYECLKTDLERSISGGVVRMRKIKEKRVRNNDDVFSQVIATIIGVVIILVLMLGVLVLVS